MTEMTGHDAEIGGHVGPKYAQLRLWAEEGMAGKVIVPLGDEDAWEGTEIDVRRKVL
ncbi:MAG TPA: hypothetical protein VGE36_17970 [Roseateles sp.]